MVLRPDTLASCSARPQIVRTESNRDEIVRQERSLSGTASGEDGIEIHRVVLFCFVGLMLIPGVEGKGI